MVPDNGGESCIDPFPLILGVYQTCHTGLTDPVDQSSVISDQTGMMIRTVVFFFNIFLNVCPPHDCDDFSLEFRSLDRPEKTAVFCSLAVVTQDEELVFF